MTIEEAREYWSRRLERAEGYSDEHWDAEERHAHADYIDALKHAVTALAIFRDREEAAKKPKTVRCGRWILIGRSRITKSRDLKCSVCGNYFRVYDDVTLNAGRGDANFCPNCGAHMDLRTPTEVDLDIVDSVMMGGADNG